MVGPAGGVRNNNPRMACPAHFAWTSRREWAMRHLTIAVLVAAATAAMLCEAVAESNTIGGTITSDRDPNRFGDPKDIKYELNGAHTFDSGLILGGSFRYRDRAFSDR